jgi:endonuclease/exonuclease/phosphatase family metal-dependent hydrolase
MIQHLLRKRRVVDGRTINEPTLLALGMTAAVPLMLLALLGGVAFATASFGLGWALFAVVAGLLGALLLALRHRPYTSGLVTGRQRWARWLCQGGSKAVVVMLAAWMGLIAWSQVCPGGTMPGPKAEVGVVRVVTWNILRGQEQGPPWEQNNWRARKLALGQALRDAQPDILLVQEARLPQLNFLDETLPGHDRVGVGRDDGKEAGEHCAIYFSRQRFEQLDGGTFWLQGTTDRPGSGLGVQRICTWVRLRDQASGRTLRVYNTHQYLTAGAQLPAAQIILHRLQAGEPSDIVLLGGDFNATPDAPSRRLFAEAGLREAADVAGASPGGTYQFCGVCWRCLDGILLGEGLQVRQYAVLNIKPRGLFPSDHFGVLADLMLQPQP